MPLITSTSPSLNRLVVLGLDGLSLDLAHRLARSGACPHLSRLLDTTCASPMRAELPELSPVNWTSFATAAGPEEHGVFGFTQLDPHNYNVRITNFTQVSQPTIFDVLGNAGLVSRVVNLPGLYPARPVVGGRSVVIAGFPGEDLFQALAPSALAGPLASMGYVIEGSTELGLTDPSALLDELRRSLAGRRAALNLLWPDLGWDLFVYVLTETDRLFHFLYPAVENPDEPLHAACAAFLGEWDQLIGVFLDCYEALPGPKRLLALADHGFGHLRTECDINAWLREHGLLRTGQPAHALDGSCIAHESAAFALDPGRIFLHDARFSRGHSTLDRGRLLQEIQQGLLSLSWNGTPVMGAVHVGNELYPSSNHSHTPDLVCEPAAGFDLKAKFDRSDLFSVHGRRGTHRLDDVLFCDSLGEKAERVRDVGRTVLSHFQV